MSAAVRSGRLCLGLDVLDAGGTSGAVPADVQAGGDEERGHHRQDRVGCRTVGPGYTCRADPDDTGSGRGGQMDRGEFGRVDDDVDAGDPAFGDGERDDGEKGSVGVPGHVAGDAVDQHGSVAGDLAGEHAGAGGDLGGAEGDDHAVGLWP